MDQIDDNNVNVSYSDYDYNDENTLTHLPFTVILCSLYAIVFLFGLIGNVWILVNIVRIFKVCSFKKNRTFINGSGEYNKPSLKIHFSTVIHMFVLSIVDILVLSNVPFIISDLWFKTWLFGFHLCKFYWTVDTVNKVLSIFVLTLMSFERYSVVCKFRSFNACFRTGRGTVLTMLLVCLIVTLITYPVYMNGTLTHIGRYYEANNETVFVESIKKCTIEMGDEDASMFTIIIFSIGFCSPSILIAFFYGRILLRLRNHCRSVRSLVSQIPVKKVTCTVLTLVVTYFVCWTPFWCVTVYSALNSDFRNSTDYRHAYLLQTTNLLVYVNSALNWIVYTYLNGNFKAIRKSVSIASSRSNVEPETSRLLFVSRNKFNGGNGITVGAEAYV